MNKKLEVIILLVCFSVIGCFYNNRAIANGCAKEPKTLSIEEMEMLIGGAGCSEKCVSTLCPDSPGPPYNGCGVSVCVGDPPKCSPTRGYYVKHNILSCASPFDTWKCWYEGTQVCYTIYYCTCKEYWGVYFCVTGGGVAGYGDTPDCKNSVIT